MELYVLRHGIAVDRGEPGYAVDADRPLTAEGLKKMRQIAQGMKSMELSFDLVLSSPYLRAKQTAEIVAGVLMIEKHMELSMNLEPDGSIKSLLAELKKNYAGRRSVLVVGHEPLLSQLISVLVSGNDGLLIVMKKGGLCKLTIDELTIGRCAALDWLMTPRQMMCLKECR
jgi:phosphohistidine phosphatase